MFHMQQSHDALIFEDLSSIGHDKLLEELLAESDEPTTNNDLNVNNQCSKKKGKGKAHQESKGEGSNKELKKGKEKSRQKSKGDESNKELKKVMHREIERQRRQEMAALFASLRSLLPLEDIKGKRSTCDHMDEAVKYIKHMQKRIEGKRNRREKLKNVSTSSNSRVHEQMNVNDLTSFVKVNLFGDEIEILISSGLVDEEFPLSRVLIELLGRGLNVLTCVSSRANERSLHKIQIQANDPRRINLLELQKNLANLIKLA